MRFVRNTYQARTVNGDDEGLRALRRGWCLGSAEFKHPAFRIPLSESQKKINQLTKRLFKQ
jgi:hypothetical protein